MFRVLCFCLSCDACSDRCCLIGSSYACFFMQMLYGLFVFVSDIIGDHIVLPYSSVVLVTAVYVLSSVFLDFPQCVVVRAFSIFVVFFSVSVVRKCVWGRMLYLVFLWFCPWRVLCCLQLVLFLLSALLGVVGIALFVFLRGLELIILFGPVEYVLQV